MRATVFACAAIGFLIAGQSHGACTKPVAPSCATQNGGFENVAAFDRCRTEMLAYKGGMDAAVACLEQDASPAAETQAVRDQLQDTLDQFNGRARATPAPG